MRRAIHLAIVTAILPSRLASAQPPPAGESPRNDTAPAEPPAIAPTPPNGAPAASAGDDTPDTLPPDGNATSGSGELTDLSLGDLLDMDLKTFLASRKAEKLYLSPSVITVITRIASSRRNPSLQLIGFSSARTAPSTGNSAKFPLTPTCATQANMLSRFASSPCM